MPTFDLMSARAFAVAALCCAPVTAQATWIVDDTPGPGVHFPSISAALLVAGPFDIVDVRPGDYGPFSLVRSTRIIGAVGATVTGTSVVQGLAAGTWTFIADLTLERLHAIDVDGTLLLDELRMTGATTTIDLRDCRDVRGRRIRAVAPVPGSSAGSQVRVEGSRVQLVDSEIEGNYSFAAGWILFPRSGQLGIEVLNSSFLQLDHCSVRGGEGGSFHVSYPSESADWGGDACDVSSGSSVLCVESFLRGGDGGFAINGDPSQDGSGGIGLVAHGGQHRAWHTQFEGGQRGGYKQHALGVWLRDGATLDTSRDLPSLVPVGTPHDGGQVMVELRSEPGASAQLHVGRLPVIVPFAGSVLPRLVDVGRTASVGTVPPTGLLTVPLTLGPWPRGTVLFLQGARTTAVNVELTSAAAIIVR